KPIHPATGPGVDFRRRTLPRTRLLCPEERLQPTGRQVQTGGVASVAGTLGLVLVEPDVIAAGRGQPFLLPDPGHDENAGLQREGVVLFGLTVLVENVRVFS